MYPGLVNITTYASIIIQFITGLLSYDGVKYNLPVPHKVLSDALNLELIVQIVEMFFYIILISFITLKDMAMVRYFDWFVTTPVMLFTTMLVYEYLINVENKNEEEKDTELTFSRFVKQYKNVIITVVLSNFAMLLFGFLGEIGVISIYTATIAGFVALAVSFYVIYDKFAYKLDGMDRNLFYTLVIFWSLYGIAYLFPVAQKNITYNFLDIISKNFFGVYLYYKIVMVSKYLKARYIL